MLLIYVMSGDLNAMKLDLISKDSLFDIQSDSTLMDYQKKYNEAIKETDTVKQISYLIKMGDIHYDNNSFQKSLEHITEALFLSDRKKMMIEKSIILSQLGNLYIKFGNIEIGENYIIESHKLTKKYIKEKKIKPSTLLISYQSLIEIERRKHNNEKALVYLDSCFVLANALKSPYSKLRKFYRIKAGLLTSINNFDEAIKILMPLDKHYDSIAVSGKLKSNYLSDHILVASNIARIHHVMGNKDMALKNYHKSLKLITKFNKKLDHQSHVLKKIAMLYEEKNNYIEAYKYLMQSNEYSEKYFKLTSDRNKGVLEIRDSYKKSLNEKEKELMSQNFTLIKNEKAILRFKVLILIIGILLVIGVFLIKYKIDKINHKNEKKIIKDDALRIQEQLEYKNKELTTYALQLMERDDLLDRLIGFIDKDKSKEAKSLKIERKQLILNSWDEFEKRFVEVNAGFYERILQKFPDLTIGDRKYCALLKLNLRGKEISKLLSVTEKSVHMARYRIRKKFNLDTDENLVEYLNKI